MGARRAAEDTTTIAHSIQFDAPPAVLFEMYADAREHSKVIDARVRFERRVGGRFSAWGGEVSGLNVVLRKPSVVVQAWRTSEFPKDHHSVLHLSITPTGVGRSTLTLTQHGVPIACAEDVEANWHECYWKPMKQMLAAKSERKGKRRG
jgi:activator of HSP90 ATPase